MSGAPERILVVDDEEAIREIVSSMLNAGGKYICSQAASGAEALALLESGEEFALMLSDLMMAGMDGIALLERTKERIPEMPVIMVTAVHDISVALAAIRNGAYDYLLKPFNPIELGARVRALLRRDHGDPSPVVIIGNLTVDRNHATAAVAGRQLKLRRREWAVLDRLTAKAGEVVSKERLLAEIFSFDDEVAPNALEVHVARLRKKLEPDGPVIKTLRGLGYMLNAS